MASFTPSPSDGAIAPATKQRNLYNRNHVREPLKRGHYVYQKALLVVGILACCKTLAQLALNSRDTALSLLLERSPSECDDTSLYPYDLAGDWNRIKRSIVLDITIALAFLIQNLLP